MIRDLLTPEAHRDPYVWAAVLLAHAWIGGSAYPLAGWWVIVAYAAFERVQALYARKSFVWDSVLDWCAVSLGAATVAFGSSWPSGAVLFVAFLGYRVRMRHDV